MVSNRRPISATGYTTYVNSSFISPTLSTHTSQIGQIQVAFQNLKDSIIGRGSVYANNSIASRAGFMAENWHTETYNIDAIIQRFPTRATTEGSVARASADVSFDGDKFASMKYYKDAQSSAKAQSNPEYGDLYRVVSSDQFEEANDYLMKSAKHDRMVGREEVAKHKEYVASKITDRISDNKGRESTPLSHEQSNDLAKSIKKDDSGKIIVDQETIDEVCKKTGVKQKVSKAIVKEKITGIGIATAIGLATGFTIGFITTLAQSGINPSSIKYALISGAKASVESGAVSAASSTLGVTIGSVASKALADSIITRLGESVAETTLKKISDMCNLGVVGAITIVALSVYEFVKLKHMGFSTKESLIRTGKSAALSASVLVLSIVATGIWGTPAGIVVSIVAGVIMTGVTVITTIHNKQLMEKIALHTIKISQPNYA